MISSTQRLFNRNQMLIFPLLLWGGAAVLHYILVQALRRVGRGEQLLDPHLTGQVFAKLRQIRACERAETFASLSERELRVLALVAEGKTNREIGEALYLSEKTVRNYVSGILAKLSLTSRVQAAAYAACLALRTIFAGEMKHEGS